jgi:hypothetical protein
MQMRTTKTTPPLTVSLIAYNPKTNRCERLIHVGRVNSPATSREMLRLVQRALKEQTTRITF